MPDCLIHTSKTNVDGLAISCPRLGQSVRVVIEVTMAKHLLRLLFDLTVIEHGQRLPHDCSSQLDSMSE